jgi:hypothetical protein
MKPNWEMIDLLLEVQLKYAEFLELLLKNEEVDRAMTAHKVVAPALTLGVVLGEVMAFFGVSTAEYNKRAEETGRKTLHAFGKEG